MKINRSVRIAVTGIALSLLLAVSAIGDEKQDQEKLDAIKSGITAIESRLPEFNSLYKKCQAKKIALDYPTVTKTMLDQFIPYAKEDLENRCIWRAEYAVKDMNNSLDQSIATMKAYLDDPGVVPNTRRYRTSKVDIKGMNLIADRIDSKGKKDRGPVHFVGHGHFFQINEDMPKWPGYGINIIQSGILGPSGVLTAEDKIDWGTVNLLRKSLDDAAKHNVKMDILLSPHYFPEWALNKWPDLRKGGGGFLGFNVDAPEAKYVIEKFIRLVVPVFKDHPALNSFCISNEPTLERMAGAPNTRGMWNDYLIRVHGDIKTLNERYGTDYKSFDDVPVPGNESYDDPQYYDWCVFLQERFAAWHEWMAGIVREIAPNVPLHAKMMSMAIPHRFTISWACDPELFGKFSDLYGNDCLTRPSAQIGGPGWSVPWVIQNTNYDLQRSMAGKPIFNSENHPTDDNSTGYLAPDHFRNVYWQGAIHGQSATTTWVWERAKPWTKYEPTFLGNVMDRPGCAEAMGMTCLDLNRFAEEVSALQQAKSPVAILFSIPSICKTADYMNGVQRFYTALNFCGVKIDFISERQMAQGKAKNYKVIVIPYAANVQPSTIEELKRLPAGTKLIVSGNSLEKDPYNRLYPADEIAKIKGKAVNVDCTNADCSLMFPQVYDQLARTGGLSEYTVIDTATGKPAWGIEWLPAKVGNRTIINLTNLSDKPLTVKVLHNNKEVELKDLLSLGGKVKVGLLKPMQVALGEVVN